MHPKTCLQEVVVRNTKYIQLYLYSMSQGIFRLYIESLESLFVKLNSSTKYPINPQISQTSMIICIVSKIKKGLQNQINYLTNASNMEKKIPTLQNSMIRMNSRCSTTTLLLLTLSIVRVRILPKRFKLEQFLKNYFCKIFSCVCINKRNKEYKSFFAFTKNHQSIEELCIEKIFSLQQTKYSK